jgi:hypothetical protein
MACGPPFVSLCKGWGTLPLENLSRQELHERAQIAENNRQIFLGKCPKRPPIVI